MKLKILLGILLVSIAYFRVAQAQSPSPTPEPATITASTNASAPAIDPAKEVEIRKMLKLTGTLKMMDQMKDQMITLFKNQRPNIPQDFWEHFSKEMDTQELLDEMMPLYDKYYSLDDLKAVNAFYESPAGQRVLSSTPQIMRESVALGAAWGKRVGERVEAELTNEKESATTTPPAK